MDEAQVSGRLLRPPSGFGKEGEERPRGDERRTSGRKGPAFRRAMSGNDVVQVGHGLAGRDRAAARAQDALEVFSLPEVGHEGLTRQPAQNELGQRLGHRRWIV